jgi:NuA3 HAT complex component NTO1
MIVGLIADGSSMDRQELFLHPVIRAEVPDYFDIIKEPMSWLQIDEKLEKNAYRSIAEFKASRRTCVYSPG